MSKTQGRAVRRLDTGETYPSATAAARAIHKAPSTIHAAICKQIRAGGTYWEYIDDPLPPDFDTSPKTPKPKPNLQGRAFLMSERLRDAANQMGIEAFRNGLELIRRNPDLIQQENLAQDENGVNYILKDLTDEEVQQIGTLANAYTAGSCSMLVRQVVEAVILRDGMVEFEKPPGWTSSPLALHQGGKNPVDLLPEEQWPTSVTLPLYIYPMLKHLLMPRGHAIRPDTMDLSRYVRLALDNVEPSTLRHYELLVPSIPIRRVKSQALSLLKRHRRIVKSLQNEEFNASRVVGAALHQQLNRDGNAVLPPAQAKWWQTWQAVAAFNSIDKAAAEIGMDSDDLMDELESAGYIDLRPKHTAKRVYGNYTAVDYVNAIKQYGSIKRAAAALSVGASTIRKELSRAGIKSADIKREVANTPPQKPSSSDSPLRQPSNPEVQNHASLAEENPHYEGAILRRMVKSYERDPRARRKCINHYGTTCLVCHFDFSRVYGELGKGFIEVHHVYPLSKIGKEYIVNPVTDLRPVCSNCHRMIHRLIRRQPRSFSIEEIREIILKTDGP